MFHRSHVLIAAFACAVSIIPGIPAAHAAPTMGGGDCWRSGTPLWCRGTWKSGEFLRIYTLDRFSDARPAWSSAYSTSNSRWSSAAGPQLFATYRRANDSWIFYEDSQSGSDGLTSSSRATTWSCDYSSYCSRYIEPMYVKFSSIKLNKSLIANDSGTRTTRTFMHESGHALGLAHHPSSTDLMYATTNDATAPSADNQGALPPCTGSSSTSNGTNIHAGVRCVYNWKM